MDETTQGRRILVGLDGSPNGAAALRWAVGEASAVAGQVEAVFVWQLPSLAYSAPGFIPPDESTIEDEGRRILEAALRPIAPGDADAAKVSLRVAEGAPALVLGDAVGDPEVSLLVVGARGHGGMSGLLLGSVSHSLTHQCHKPLVIVPRSWGPGDGRIVVGVDGSSESVRALKWGVAEARARRCRLEAVMVCPAAGPVLLVHRPRSEEAGSAAKAELEARLDNAVRRVDAAGVVVEQVVLDGHPARTLLGRAADADLLVVGTRGLGRAHETVSGSVSHSCTNHASIPVAVIPGPA